MKADIMRTANLVKDRVSSSRILKIDFLKKRAIPGVTLVLALLCIMLGCACLVSKSLDVYASALISLLSLSLLSLFFDIRRVYDKWDRKFLVLVILSFASAITLWALPEYLQKPLGFSAPFMHHSVFSALLLIGVSIPSICVSLNYFLGAAPRSQDTSRYPLLIIPILLAMMVFVLFIVYVIAKGAPHLTWTGITTFYQDTQVQKMTYQDGWPVWTLQTIKVAGLASYILGTLLLMGLTSLISLPIGIGVGVYLSEYSRGAFSSIVRFSTGALKAMSVIILALTAYYLVGWAQGNRFSDLFAGFFYDVNGTKTVAQGSFITAAIFLSFLVIPVIARCTEEGLRSLPNELREGSLALGASKEYTLARILLPWSAPNIITGLILGCAEVAGGVAVIMFIAGNGGHGIGGIWPLGETTSLDYMVFGVQSTDSLNYKDLMGYYQWSAALLVLIIALGLSIAGVVLKHKFSKRYRGT